MNINPEMTFKKLCYMYMQSLTNFPYIEQDFDALTNYELISKVVKYLNDVIENSNEQNESITNLYNAFMALQNYVNSKVDELETDFNELDTYVRNYFDNLDVQEEINNKLDEMLADGVLEQIIEQFLQSTALWTFDTVADMKVATNLTNGSYVKTLGFNSINDGGASIYKIRTKLENEIPNEMDIISINETLVAELKNDKSYVLPEQFGAYGDLVSFSTPYHDDKNSIQACIDYAVLHNYAIHFMKKEYYVSDTLYLKDNNTNINGNSGRIYSDTTNPIISMNSGDVLRYCVIENLNIQGADNTETTNYGMLVRGIYTIFRNINISHVASAFKMDSEGVDGNLVGNRYENMGLRYCTVSGMILGDSDNQKITDGWILNCNIGSCGNKYLYIGSCAGYKINNLHTWGQTQNPIELHNLSRTNIDGLYIESFTQYAIIGHMARDCNISNVTVKAIYNDTMFFKCEQSLTARPRNVNMTNIFIDTNDEVEPTGFTFLGGENRHDVDINIVNLRIALSNYTLKQSSRANLHLKIIDRKLVNFLGTSSIDYTATPTLKDYVNSLADGFYIINGNPQSITFTDLPTTFSSGSIQLQIYKDSSLTPSTIDLFHRSTSSQSMYKGYYTSNSDTATRWRQITLS